MDAELKVMFEEMQNAVGELRTTLDESKGNVDILVDSKIEKLNNRIDELDAKLTGRKAGFQGTGTESDPDEEKRKIASKSFDKFIRKGLDIQPEERKALVVSTDDAGGYTVPDDWRMEMMKELPDLSKMRGLCRTVQTKRDRIIIPKQNGTMDWTWIDEDGLPADQNTADKFGQITINVHNAGGLIKASQNLLEDSAFDIQSYISTEFRDSLALEEDDVFLGGSGNGQPEGLLTNLPATCIVQTAVANTVDCDDMLDFVYDLEEKYAARPSSKIMCRRQFVKVLRKFKDANDQYLWQPSLQIGEPSTFDGIAIVQPSSTQLDTAIASGNTVAVFGAYEYYWIVDRIEMSVQRMDEKYAPLIGYFFRVRRGGKRMLDNAFRTLQIK